MCRFSLRQGTITDIFTTALESVSADSVGMGTLDSVSLKYRADDQTVELQYWCELSPARHGFGVCRFRKLDWRLGGRGRWCAPETHQRCADVDAVALRCVIARNADRAARNGLVHFGRLHGARHENQPIRFTGVGMQRAKFRRSFRETPNHYPM